VKREHYETITSLLLRARAGYGLVEADIFTYNLMTLPLGHFLLIPDI